MQAFGAAVAQDDLGLTVMHEHIFVRDPELEQNLPGIANPRRLVTPVEGQFAMTSTGRTGLRPC